jgi:hypothetical protein
MLKPDHDTGGVGGMGGPLRVDVVLLLLEERVVDFVWLLLEERLVDDLDDVVE